MEFLDPKKRKYFFVRLIIGYVLVAAALILTTIILLYYAYGFGIKNGEVIQNGLIFVATRPRPADVYINGQIYKDTTNTRVLMPAGQYTVWLERPGYRTWRRAINIEGGAVARFDYPVLFPTNLITTVAKQYESRPGFVTQSPNQRWLLVQTTPGYLSLEVFDLNDASKAPTPLSIPQSLFTLTQGTHRWEALQWASDNHHVLLRHSTDNGGVAASEYILLDREAIQASVNLTTLLRFNPTTIELRDNKFDRYFLYDQAGRSLTTATLDDPTIRPYLDNVLAFKASGRDTVLFATNRDAQPDKTAIKLFQNGKTYAIRQVGSGSGYLLDISRYDGSWYIVAGASADNRTYVYKNPASSLDKAPQDPLVPVHVFKTAAPTYVSFSENFRFIMAEQGQQFAVYDAETRKGYAYAAPAPLDAPQTHAVWMDGHRLMYVSGGSAVVFDFDNTNQQTLSAADPSFTPSFDSKFRFLYTLGTSVVKAPDGTDKPVFPLSSTALLTPQDL